MAGSRSIDDYIRSSPDEVRGKLEQLRRAIREAAPEAQEKISYRMPTFYLNGNLVHFAAHSQHIGFYPTPSGILKFKKELERYKSTKGAVQFPLEEPLPLELVRRIVLFRLEENRSRKR